MIKAQYTKRNHMLSIIDTNCTRTPTVSAKTGCVDIIFEDDETAMAVRDAITAEHPFEPKDQPASADGPDMSDVRGLFGELQDDLAEATYIDLLNHRGDMGDLQFYIGRMDAFSTALACCRQDDRRLELARAWEAGYSAGWTDQQCDFPPHTADNPFKERQ